MKKILPFIYTILLFTYVGNVSYAQNTNLSGFKAKLTLGINGISINNAKELQNIQRRVELRFYSPDINTADKSAAPVAFIVINTEFNRNTDSAVFGKYISSEIDLRDKIAPGKYQIVIKADKALPYLIDTNLGEIGGDIFEINSNSKKILNLDVDNVLLGDIYPVPHGDNILDINDYNLLTSCYLKALSENPCPDALAIDLDENGEINGIDYNIMFASINKLAELGFPVPSIEDPASTIKSDNPSITPNHIKLKENDENTSRIETQSINSRGIFLAVAIIVFILIIFIFSFIKRQKLKSFIDVMIHKNSKKDQVLPKTDEIDPKELENINKEIDKEYYVKKQTYDETKKLSVLTLTDDSGPTLGYYSQKEISDGFARVKGIIKKDKEKVFIDIISITPIT